MVDIFILIVFNEKLRDTFIFIEQNSAISDKNVTSGNIVDTRSLRTYILTLQLVLPIEPFDLKFDIHLFLRARDKSHLF